MRRWTALVVTSLVLVACSDSRPPATTRSAFNPFPNDNSPSAASEPPTAPSVLLVGQCFDTDDFSPGSSIVRTGVHVADCAGPHQHEVYAVVADPDGPETGYPGDDALASVADDLCLAAFTPAFGVDYQTSTLDFATIKPDRGAWDAGERTIVCAVHDTDFQPLTGSHVPPPTTTTATTAPPTSLSSESG